METSVSAGGGDKSSDEGFVMDPTKIKVRVKHEQSEVNLWRPIIDHSDAKGEPKGWET